VFEKSEDTWTFGENHPAVARQYRLRSARRVRWVAASTPASVVVFKPLCDSQWTDRLLIEHPQARVLWMVRRPEDVAASANVKWADHQRDVLRRIHVRDWEALGWRGERLSPMVLSCVDAHYRAEMSPAAACVLYWWVRNQLFFELGLDREPRVQVVRYETLVTDPEALFEKVFEFIGVPFHPSYVAQVHRRSVQTAPVEGLEPAVSALAQETLARLDACVDG